MGSNYNWNECTVKVLINYAAGTHQHAQERNSNSGLKAGFDKVVSFNPSNLDPEFRTRNSQTLTQPRGAGYWLWKPYIINTALNSLPPNSFLGYCDSGAYFCSSILPAVWALVNSEQSILCFEHAGNHFEEVWTKGDTAKLMNYSFAKRKQAVASYIFFRVDNFSKNFVKLWLQYSEDPRILTDLPSETPNPPEFRDHRHDQAVFSILCHQFNLKMFRDPSQFGDEELTLPDVVARSTYPQFIVNNRDRD